MRKVLIVSCLISLLFSMACDFCYSADHSSSSNPADILLISGVVTERMEASSGGRWLSGLALAEMGL